MLIKAVESIFLDKFDQFVPLEPFFASRIVQYKFFIFTPTYSYIIYRLLHLPFYLTKL